VESWIPHPLICGGALHDTTKDESNNYDLIDDGSKIYVCIRKCRAFHYAGIDSKLYGASRRFATLSKAQSTVQFMQLESEHSPFEPRPEYNHDCNSLCINPEVYSATPFLDRRAFLNSMIIGKIRMEKVDRRGGASLWR
jgi:hypothetical protein